MNDLLTGVVILILMGVLIIEVVNFPKWMGAKVKRDRERRAYYDSPYEPGDPAWRRKVPPWTNEGIDEQPRSVHHHQHHPEHQHHQAPGISPTLAPQHHHHEPGGSSRPEPHHHLPPSGPPPMHHHS